MEALNGSVHLSKLRLGEQGIVVEVEKSDWGLKLMEMGILPGELITIDRIAPLGDPISIRIQSYLLSLRRHEARAVTVIPIIKKSR